MANEAKKLEQFAPPEAERGEQAGKGIFATGTDVLRRADRDVLEAKTEIENARESIRESGEFPVYQPNEAEEVDAGWTDEPAKQLKSAEEDVDAAWDELSKNVSQIENAETEPFDAYTSFASSLETGTVTEKLQKWSETEEGKESLIAWFDESIAGSIMKERVDFSSFERAVRAANASETFGSSAREALTHIVSAPYAERLLADSSYRERLANLQTALSKRVSENGPLFSSESDIKQLILANEMAGEKIIDMAKAANLQNFAPELSLSEKLQRIIQFTEVNFDEQTGDCLGKIAIDYQYGKSGDEEKEPGIARVLLRERNLNTQEIERTSLLDYIRLPDSMKSKNAAKNEMIAHGALIAESGFDAQTLHANIDIGGYAWAALGYGWDIEEMRRADETALSKEDIISNFVADRIAVVRDQLTVNDIDSTFLDAMMKTAADGIASEGRAITPQDLATLGKDGPFFIKGTSGRLYREEDYEGSKESDPPASDVKGRQHVGKLLLIWSDWYGRKPVKKSE